MKPLLHICAASLVSCLCSAAWAACVQVGGANDGYGEYSRGALSYECMTERYCGSDKNVTLWNISRDRLLVRKHDKLKYPNLSRNKQSLPEISKLYIETQNQIFNCALLKSKLQIHEALAKREGISQSIKTLLEELNESLQGELKQNNCTPNKKDSKLYVHKDLLDETTYEHCVYAMYLHYMKGASRANIGLVVDRNMPSSELANLIETFGAQVDQELAKADRVYEAALRQYGPFEQSYPAHVLLQFIDYELISIRKYVSVSVKAIVQTFIKAVNTQKSQKST